MSGSVPDPNAVTALARSVVSAPETGVSSLASVAVSGNSIGWAVGNASGQTLVEQNLAP